MAGEWKETSLGAVMDVKHGFAFPGENIRDKPPGDILLTPGNFAIGGGFKGDKFKYFDGEVPEDYVLKEGELVLTMTDLSKQADTLGYPAIVPKPRGPRFLHNQRLGKVLIKHDAELDRGFLFYLLRTAEYRNEVLASATGTTVKHTSPGRILAHKATIPPLAEQKSIAAVLGALDDKIKLNRRMNATLEAMARSLFQSWFVDFDPVRRNKDEGGRTKDEISALFPDSFQESELGLIPKGWEACPLAELIEVVKGRSYRSEELAESKTALVTLKSFLRGGGYRADGLKPFTGEYKPNQRVYPGDLVVAFTDVTQAADVIGKPALIRSDDRFNTLVASLDVGIVRVRSERVSMSYLYCLFLTAEFQAHTYSHATGTTVLHLGSTAIPSFVSVVPPVEIAEKFAERADPIFRLIDENAKQSRTLATLRDALLPKLLSGELSVAKIESHFV
jgi:type I restriction enzyme S subunit